MGSSRTLSGPSTDAGSAPQAAGEAVRRILAEWLGLLPWSDARPRAFNQETRIHETTDSSVEANG